MLKTIVFDPDDGSTYFAIPNSCRQIWVDMTGGGGGGGGSNSTQGGSGGSPSPCIKGLLIEVSPGCAIGVYVGRGLAGGTPASTSGESSSLGVEIQSVIFGTALLSPCCDRGTWKALYSGWGRSGGAFVSNAYVNAPTQGYVYGNFGNQANGIPMNMQTGLPAGGVAGKYHFYEGFGLTWLGDAPRSGIADPYSYGAASLFTINGKGVGATYQNNGVNGSGAGGGGNLFGRGGAGGNPAGDVNGQDGELGCGGGGAANGGNGGRGGDGFVAFTYFG